MASSRIRKLSIAVASLQAAGQFTSGAAVAADSHLHSGGAANIFSALLPAHPLPVITPVLPFSPFQSHIPIVPVSGAQAANFNHHLPAAVCFPFLWNSATSNQTHAAHLPTATATAIQAISRDSSSFNDFLSLVGGNLDLSSATATIKADSLDSFRPVSIVVHGKSLEISASSLLTPAEASALLQVLTSDHQSLRLMADGAADGGSPSIGAASLTALTIPRGVTVIDTATAAQSLNLSGGLSNSGRLQFDSVGGANIALNTNNLLNETGGKISFVSMPASVLGSISHTLGSISIGATDSFVNHGSITADGNLNLSSNNISNSGTIQSTKGNISLGNFSGNSLSLHNSGQIWPPNPSI